MKSFTLAGASGLVRGGVFGGGRPHCPLDGRIAPGRPHCPLDGRIARWTAALPAAAASRSGALVIFKAFVRF
jgi:hypothetical protein